LEEEAVDRILWRTCVGRGNGFCKTHYRINEDEYVLEHLKKETLPKKKITNSAVLKLHVGVCTQLNASLNNERKIISLFTTAICWKDNMYVLFSSVVYLLFHIARNWKQETENRRLYINLSGPLVLVGRMLFAKLMARNGFISEAKRRDV